MDDIDYQLLHLLTENSRESLVSLSKKVNLSRPSVKERINKLIEQGVIEKFTLSVAPEFYEKGITFFSELRNVSLSESRIVKMLQNDDNVLEFYIVSGETNYLVKSSVNSTLEMKKKLAEWMTFASVKSSVVLTGYRNDHSYHSRR